MLYKDTRTEEHFIYYYKMNLDDFVLLIELDTNYTIVGKDVSSVNASVLSQEKARYIYCDILKHIKDIVENKNKKL